MFSKRITTILALSVMFFSTLLITSCDDDETPVTGGEVPLSIVELAKQTSSLSTLVSALERADLVSALEADGPFTVFAPSNEAFQGLLDSKVAWNTLEDIPVDVLTNVLLYHVVGAKALSTDLTNEQEITTLLTDGTVMVDLTDGVKIKTGADQAVDVVTANINATNGVIHVVNEVFLPEVLEKDIADLAVATPDLSILVDALIKTDLVGTFTMEGPYTVFAPTNTAFETLLSENNWSSLDDIPVDTLKNILLFHVLSGKVMSTDLSDTYVNTLAVGPDDTMLSLQISTTNGVKFNGDADPSELLDVEASNGVVHVIKKVMLPPNIVTLALNNAGFTTLVAALTDSRHTTDFVSVLSGDGPFTVFAPTNDAFQALLDSDAAWNSLADIDIATLETVLLYHVVNMNVQAKDLSDQAVVPTLLTDANVTVDLSSGAQLVTSSGQTVDIIVGAATNDVQATNGVIHAVRTVLLP